MKFLYKSAFICTFFHNIYKEVILILKRFWIKKILVATSALFALFLICLIPNTKEKVLKNIDQELEYVDYEVEKAEVFLMDVNGYLARTSMIVNGKTVEEKAKEILEALIKGSSGESKLPNGFMGIIPSETRILSIQYKDDVLKVNFSKDILDTKKDMEEKLIEAIVYNLTSIDGVEKIIIYVDGDILTKLPQTGINLPATLDRSFGINKEYDIKSTKNLTDVTIYYISKYNDKEYYVPVTKYVNDDREKIQIIVDELASTPIYNSNLMSYLNSNTKLLTISQSVESLDLVFNSYIFSDAIEKEILEEVIYTIALSVRDNYNVKEVSFQIEDEEIYKSVLKTIE